MTEIMTIFRTERFVAVVRNISPENIVDVSKALYKGGVRLMEITYNQSLADPISQAQKSISLLAEAMEGKMVIGAGTVLSAGQVRAARDAGARFIVSPNTNPEVIQETRRLGLVSVPGAMTPTEIELAYHTGGDMIKLFPADNLGYHYIKNITAPLSHIPIMASGGVNPDTIPLYFQVGVTAAAAGITMVTPQLVAEKNYEEIAQRAKAHIAAVKRFKENFR